MKPNINIFSSFLQSMLVFLNTMHAWKTVVFNLTVKLLGLNPGPLVQKTWLALGLISLHIGSM